MESKLNKVVFYADEKVWSQLRDIAPDGQLSKFVRFILADAVAKIERGDYQDEIGAFAKQSFKAAFIEDKAA